MLIEIVKHLEAMAAGLGSARLIGLGLSAVVLGLFVWLGGLGFKKILLAAIGAALGSIGAYLILGPRLIPVAVSAVAGIVIAIVLEKIVVAIIAASLAAVAALVALDRFIKFDLEKGLNQILPQTPAYGWVLIAALVLLFILAAFYLRRFVSALSCAALGTLLIFGGIILLLFYKGAAPAAGIKSNPSMYSATFIAMTAFGTIVQLLLCQRFEKKPVKKPQATVQEEVGDQQPANWRMQ